MATTITRYINTGAASGGDGTTRALSGANAAYQTFDIAQAAEAKDITLATGTDEIFDFKCAGGADSDISQLDAAWLCSAGNYIIVEADDDDVHAGVLDTGKYHFTAVSSSAGLRAPADMGRIIYRNLQFYPAASGATNRRSLGIRGAASFANGPTVENCLFNGSRLTGSNASAIIGTNGSGFATIRNNLFVDYTGVQTAGMTVDPLSLASDWNIFNNTFDHCTVAIGSANKAGQPSVQNCLFSQCTDDWDSGNASGNNNASTKGSSVGTSPRLSQTFDFVDEAGNDFHLTADDTGAFEFGTDLSGHSDSPVTTDFEGDARDASTPDIGFDEVDTGTAPTVLQPTGSEMVMSHNNAVNVEMVWLPDNAGSEMGMTHGVPDVGGPFDPLTLAPTGDEMGLANGTPTFSIETPSPGDPDFPGTRGRGRHRKQGGWV
jgi:hypothetical protein